MQLVETISNDWTMITIDLKKNEIIQPKDLSDIELPLVNPSSGVIVDGRAPTWLHAYLLSQYASARWIAINDPKQEGAVVVRTHSPDHPIGSIQSTVLIA